MEDKWEFYQDFSGEWRWRRITPNGRISGYSFTAYMTRQDCMDNAKECGFIG
jgi:uncharacterized protein YegP (UPF0339 family)